MRVQYVINITLCVTKYVLINFMLSVSLPVNSRLLEVKFLRGQKLHLDFQLSVVGWGGVGVGNVSIPKSCVVEMLTVE